MIISDDQVAKILSPGLVLVGGCFDVLHDAHLEYLKKAKQHGQKLVVLLESDENIKKLKGKNRPLNNQITRAENLSKIKEVDEIILLKNPKTSTYYYNLVKLIRPDIIAITKGDPLTDIKKEQAKMVGGRVVEVIKRDPHYSSTKLINK